MTDNDWHYFDYLEHPVFVLEADEDGVPRYTAINRFACQLAGFRAEDYSVVFTGICGGCRSRN